MNTFYEQILSFAVYGVIILYDDWVGSAVAIEFDNYRKKKLAVNIRKKVMEEEDNKKQIEEL